MKKRSSYPADLSAALQQRWMEAGHDPAALPESSALESLIDTAYQASLLREEGDPVQCRVLDASIPKFSSHGHYGQRVKRFAATLRGTRIVVEGGISRWEMRIGFRE